MRCALITLPETEACSDEYHEVWMTPTEMTIDITLRNTSLEQTLLPYSNLKKLMKARQAHICPHLRMSDKKVYERAQSNQEIFALSRPRRFKERLKAAARTSKMQIRRLGRTPGTFNLSPLEDNICKKCGTRWYWEMEDPGYVHLVVHRLFPRVGELRVEHPRWINQAVPPEQGEGLEREWEDDLRTFEVQMAREMARENKEG
ncbi:MAG: hypothetical protein Q9213_007282 [Squamulea squamosa]